MHHVRHPGPLSDDIQKVQKGWIMAGRRTNAKDLYASVSTIYPRTHIIQGLPIPAIGKFPIVEAKAAGWPEIKEENWYMMALAIAAANKEAFYKIHALCNKRLEADAVGPAQYAAQYIRAPVQSLWPTSALHPCPPPPQPYPPPSSFSVMTKNGAVGFEPDYVFEMRSGDDVVFEC